MKRNFAIFDLDKTLIMTNKLEDLRARRAWHELENIDVLNKTRLYDPVLNILNSLKASGVNMSVVTNSPRRYAEKLLRHHNIQGYFNVVITYDDVGHAGIKPSPSGINLALKKLKTNAGPHITYVGDEDSDMEAAYRAGVTPIVPTWASRAPLKTAPAFVACSTVFSKYFSNTMEHTLFAERSAALKTAIFKREAVYFLSLNDQGEITPIRDDLSVIGLGRYFSKKSTLTAKLHNNHSLSIDISSKDRSNQNFPSYFVGVFSHAVRTAPAYLFNREDATFDIVTTIPSKIEKPKRMESILEAVRNKLIPHRINSAFRSDIFHFEPGTRSLKGLNPAERETEIEKLHLNRMADVAGKSVLILDDVMTTGSTFRRAKELLMLAGASSVHGAILAKTVSFLDEAEVCDKCNRLMRIRTNRSTGKTFWGCSGYSETVNKCTNTKDIS